MSTKAELEQENADLLNQVETLGTENEELLNQVKELEAHIESLPQLENGAESGHDDPGVERETKVERQARLRQRADED